jgi:hypothetical protein
VSKIDSYKNFETTARPSLPTTNLPKKRKLDSAKNDKQTIIFNEKKTISTL